MSNIIYARNTILKSISQSDAIEFTQRYHRDSCPKNISGFVAYALEYEHKPIAVAIFGNPRTARKQLTYSSELVRMTFQQGIRIVGGASKLIKGYITHIKPYDLFTYQDTYGESTDMYQHAGMTLVSQDKNKDYLVKDGYTLDTATRKQKFGMAYATRYGPDRILGTTFGQETNKTNKDLFIDAGFHLETTTGDRVYEWFNPNWTHYVYKIIGDDGKYYIGAHSEYNPNMTIDECIHDGYTGSGKRLVNYLTKHKHTKEILGIYPTRKTLFDAEKLFIGDLWETDDNNLNLCVGGKGSAKRQIPYSKVIQGVNDLATVHPELINEWHESNVGNPSEYSSSSDVSVNWQCENGHIWNTMISTRTNGKGCAICSNKKKKAGFNDLFAMRPHLQAEWGYDKNTISPKGLQLRSKESVWWTCEHNHSWQATVASRSRATTKEKTPKCPYCAGKLAIKGATDLETLYPQIAAEWDYDKNDNLPSDYLPKSGKKVSWVCSHGHKWDARPCDRVVGSGCPYCTGQRPIVGETDLASQRPELLSEWDYDKNSLFPTEVTVSSTKKVWWKCAEGHSWETAIYIRTRKRASQCPHCIGHYSVVESDDH